MNFYKKISDTCKRYPQKTAILLDNKKSVTYTELDELVARYSHALILSGVTVGDRVVSQADKSIEALLLYLACLRNGVIFVPLNTSYRDDELRYFLEDARPKLFITSCEPSGKIKSLCESINIQSEPLESAEPSRFQSLVQRAFDESEIVATNSSDTAVIIYTSGTTGRSKGAMVTHENLITNADALINLWRFSDADMLIHALPIFHVHGLFVANHCALTSGATIIWHERFDLDRIMNALPTATVLMGVPTFYTRMLGDQRLTPELVTKMRLFISGSAPLLEETHTLFEVKTGHRILERYGMSEAGMITSNPYKGERKPGTVGCPLPGVKVRITDDDGNLTQDGAKGHVQITGPNIFSGYWNNLEKTKEEFTADGWFKTGDIGEWDSDGYLSIVGRSKDLIISGGFNVYPKEIELVIDAIDGIKESAVIGVPHPDFGEAVTAAVILEPGSDLGVTQIMAETQSQLAPYKVPKTIHFLDDLPRNAMGKVQKAELRKMFSDDWVR